MHKRLRICGITLPLTPLMACANARFMMIKAYSAAAQNNTYTFFKNKSKNT